MERVIVALVLFTGLVSARAAGAGDEQPGMRAYIDPRTGGFATEPPPAEPAPPLGAAQSQPAADLQAVPAPGGGVMIDLQGQFQSPIVATVQPDGTIRLHHEPGAE